jgi:hypothetical protein
MREISSDEEDIIIDYEKVPWENIDYEKIHSASAWSSRANE